MSLERKHSPVPYLSPVNKLLGCIIIHPENLQKGIRFAEKILKQNTGQVALENSSSFRLSGILHLCFPDC